jgi:hypothetical protein
VFLLLLLFLWLLRTVAPSFARCSGSCECLPPAPALVCVLCVVCYVCVCVCGTRCACGRLLQYIYDDLGFNRPFFITYVSNTLFVLLVPVHKLFVWLRARGHCGLRPQVNPVQPATLRKVGWASAAPLCIWCWLRADTWAELFAHNTLPVRRRLLLPCGWAPCGLLPKGRTTGA